MPAEANPRTPVICALDTETTGLDANVDQIISIALILLDSSLREVSRKLVYAMPAVPVNPGAAAVNGYTHEKWAAHNAVDQKTLYVEVVETLRGCSKLLPLGHNVPFDIGFVKALFAREGKASDFGKFFSYHALDTVGSSVFFDMARFGKLDSSYKLKNLCDRFGIRLDEAHTALADVEATVELFRWQYKALGGKSPEVAVPAPVVFCHLINKQPDGNWVFTRGKHKGTTVVDQVGTGYVTWMLRTLDDLSSEQRADLEAANKRIPVAEWPSNIKNAQLTLAF
jgi:DNA polymerase-3 subunit epsilon